ncbi:hypothetical protein CYMTET_29881 [Cymbomonas tetramitiformis]|uniref:DNA (cytosine-5-)-methyltransferase n=1 Tax=Cymbomonas tetramitiformis TaxID=36881 RepID=A0AAE0KUQ7_9CHLO|nr:hypothetical protein CYMTET_29881 [Cymbomonas tetramitiformis]
MKVASLFSGCGGFELGLQRAQGYDIVLQVENDPGAQQVLKKRFPGSLLLSDICSVASLPEETDLVVAGFPCPDVSRAGPREGIAGSRTGLVRHVFRLLAKQKVPWVLLENVVGLLDRVGGAKPAIDFVVSELESLGYRWAYRVINSAGFGLPQHRRRVYILASLHGDPRDVLLAKQGCVGGVCKMLGQRKECYMCYYMEHTRDPKDEELTGAVAFDLQACLASSSPPEGRRPSVKPDITPTLLCTHQICVITPGINSKARPRLGYLEPDDAERLQGFPPGWTTPCFPVVLPGVSSSPHPSIKVGRREKERMALIGNSVSVPVAEWLGHQLKNAYKEKYSPAASVDGEDRRDGGELGSAEEPWPGAAWNITRGCSSGRTRDASRSEYPEIRAFIPLHEFRVSTVRRPSVQVVLNWEQKLREHHYTIDRCVLATLEKHGYMEKAQVQRPAPCTRPGAKVAPGDIVWARTCGPQQSSSLSPWWPARVVDVPPEFHDGNKCLPSCPPDANCATLFCPQAVLFFGDETVHLPCALNVVPFDLEFLDDKIEQPELKNSQFFQAAVEEAQALVQARSGQPSQEPPGTNSDEFIWSSYNGQQNQANNRCYKCNSCFNPSARKPCIRRTIDNLASQGKPGKLTLPAFICFIQIQSASARFNQIQSDSIGFSQLQSVSIGFNQIQSASVRFNQLQSDSVSFRQI